jgi:leader peptidase (prepilin peptidase)/N-methyltransferase
MNVMSPTPEMRWLLAAAVGITGLLVGSFLNVVIFRLPRDCMSIVRPRSRCIQCLRAIRWTENLPVVSWLALRGRCRGCGARISARYPLVELLTGAIFLAEGWAVFVQEASPIGPERIVSGAVTLAIVGALIACTFIDLEFRIIPDEISVGGMLAGLALGAAFPEWHVDRGIPNVYSGVKFHLAGLTWSLLGGLVGAGVLWVIGVAGKLVFRREAMGYGDVKLMGFLGTMLGWKGALAALVLACFVGSVIGLARLIFVRDREIPFGPFLSVGAALLLFFTRQIDSLLSRLFGGMIRLLP